MKKSFHFRHSDGRWDYVFANLSRLVKMARDGDLSAIDGRTINGREVEIFQKEGFDLVLDEMVVGVISAPRPIKVLRIERS